MDAIKPYVSRQAWGLVRLQLLTAARTGELVIMRPIDLNMSGTVWTYTPESHKTAHHGHRRTIYIGPRGQAVSGNVRGSNRKQRPQHEPGNRYTRDSYRRSIDTPRR